MVRFLIKPNFLCFFGDLRRFYSVVCRILIRPFETSGILPYQADAHAQDHERLGLEGKMLDGMVLRIQNSFGHQ
jgi:hypothetical protein